MIAIVDYGLGNLQAFANIYNRLGFPFRVARAAEELRPAEKVILPGVGAFDWAMTCLDKSGMRECLDEIVLKKKIPVLGICVGMQIMARRSDEGKMKGLAWIDGEVKKFRPIRADAPIQLPHMGWNDVIPERADELFKNLSESGRFYFLHSYYFLADQEESVLSRTDYNGPFASAVRSGNVFGVQFHPEKSHQWGIQLLKNFAELKIC